MSRELRDLLEEAEVRVRELDAELKAGESPSASEHAVAGRLAAARLEHARLSAKVKALEQRKKALASAVDHHTGRAPEVIGVAGFCVGAVIARLIWSLGEDAAPDEQLLLGGVVLLISAALYLARWRRFRPRWPR